MSDQATQTLVQTASAAQTTTQASEQAPPVNPVEIIQQLAREKIAGTDVGEIRRLEGLLAAVPAETSPAEELPPEEHVEQQQQPVKVESAAVETVPGVEPEGDLSKRYKFDDPKDQEIATLARALKVSIPRAVEILALAEPKAAIQEQAAAPAPDPTIVQIESDLQKVDEQITTIEDEDPMDPRLRVLRRSQAALLGDLSAQKTKAVLKAEIAADLSTQEVAKQQKAFNDACAAAERAAEVKYPELKDPRSAMSAVRKGLLEQMKDPKHPNHEKLWLSDVPGFLAEESAKLLGKAPSAVTQVTQQQQQQDETVRPVAGSRTSAAPAPEPTADELIAAARSRVAKALEGSGSSRRSDSEGDVMIL